MPKNDYNVTTNEIMDYLKDHVPTKDDLKNFATKNDLKNFATKEDLGKLKLDLIDAMAEKNIFKMEPFPQLILN